MTAVVPVLIGMAEPASRSSPAPGQAEERCRPDERGPAVVIEAAGLEDRPGLLRAELHSANDRDFLADDNRFVATGRIFRRAEAPVPAGRARLCFRAPCRDAFSVIVIHHRDGDRKSSLFHEGVGFPRNPKHGWSKPSAAAGRIVIGATPLCRRMS